MTKVCEIRGTHPEINTPLQPVLVAGFGCFVRQRSFGYASLQQQTKILLAKTAFAWGFIFGWVPEPLMVY